MILLGILILLLSFPLAQGPVAVIHLQGSQTIWDRNAADLDSVVVTVDGGGDDAYLYPPESFAGSDLWFEQEHKSERFHPQHGARLALGGSAEAGYLGCSKAVYAKGAIRIGDMPVGIHICVRTNEGRYAEMRIDAFDRKKKIISFTFTTWVKNDSDTIYQPR
jgi:hypothetical protein